MTQTIIAISLLVLAVAFLGWKFIGRKVKRATSDDKPCGPDCNCS